MNEQLNTGCKQEFTVNTGKYKWRCTVDYKRYWNRGSGGVNTWLGVLVGKEGLDRPLRKEGGKWILRDVGMYVCDYAGGGGVNMT